MPPPPVNAVIYRNNRKIATNEIAAPPVPSKAAVGVVAISPGYRQIKE
jgi:hypothetical protein